MPIRRMKLVLTLLVLIIFPMILVAVASAVFIAFHMANGESISSAMQALILVVNNSLPYLPYITGIPAVLIIVTAIFTSRSRIQSWFRQ